MKTYTLKICSGVVIEGKIHRRGDEVDGVSEKLALQLLRRGKAEPATIYDDPQEDGGGADEPKQPAAAASTKTPRGRGRKAEG